MSSITETLTTHCSTSPQPTPGHGLPPSKPPQLRHPRLSSAESNRERCLSKPSTPGDDMTHTYRETHTNQVATRTHQEATRTYPTTVTGQRPQHREAPQVGVKPQAQATVDRPATITGPQIPPLLTMPERSATPHMQAADNDHDRIQILQINLNKSEKAHLVIINERVSRDYDIMLIQEPYTTIFNK